MTQADPRRPVELIQCEHVFAAHAVVIRLDQAGIAAEVADSHMGNMLSMPGALGVRVLVAAGDLERARAALAAPPSPAPPDADATDEDDEEEDEEDDDDDGEGQREALDVPESAFGHATRARNTAILSVGVPLLSVYALVLLATGPQSSDPAVVARRRAAWAWAIAATLLWGGFAYAIWGA